MHLGITVKIHLQQNTTTQMFEFVQRILWTIPTSCVCVCVCVCVCERERDRVTSQWSLNRGLCSNTFEHHHCVCHASLFPSRLELMLKLTTLLTVFIFTLKAEACDCEKGYYALVVFDQSQCTVSAGQSEQTVLVWRRDFVENDVFERGGA